jgi:hypothetical protein
MLSSLLASSCVQCFISRSGVGNNAPRSEFESLFPVWGTAWGTMWKNMSIPFIYNARESLGVRYYGSTMGRAVSPR